MQAPTIRPFRASDADWLTHQHQRLYTQDEGFDDSFGPLVAGILADFVAHHDPVVDRGWIAMQSDQRLGSIFCVRLDQTTAKLRLFLLTPEARGKGLGKRLLQVCMDHARDAGFEGMQLWTHESHRAACALYAAHGWECVHSKPVRSFGVDLVEQTWSIRF